MIDYLNLAYEYERSDQDDGFLILSESVKE